MSLSVHRVGVSHGGASEAMKDLTLSLEPGEQVAVIGPSGAGKTTLLSVLAASLRPTSGQVRIAGRDPWTLSSASLRALRRRLFLAPQQPPLPPRQRVVTAVLAGRLPVWTFARALRSLWLPADAHVAASALDRFSLGEKLCRALLYGSLPQSAPELVSYTVFRWECAVRASVIMGFVGAGGLGQQMEMSMKMLAGGEVATMLAVFMLLVAIADRASRFLRDTLDPVIDRGIGRARGVAATGAALALIAAGIATLDLQWRSFLQPDAVARMAEFLAGFVPPDLSAAFVAKVAFGALETVSMSAIGTLLAAVFGVLLAIPAALPSDTLASAALRNATRGLLNGLRSIPELVWAALWVIAAGLGPLPGTLALAAHTTGVIGRLFAESLENLPAAPALALRDNGVGPAGVFLYATLPQALPQLMSYTLYRWENNIRAAAVLGVVGAGGLGQLLHYHLSLFQMQQAATVILAMLLIVAAVDAVSHVARRRLTA